MRPTPPARRRPSRRPPALAAAAASLLLAALLGGCISGRILEGYPDYPFLAFDVPAAPDSTFFDVQRELGTEGFEIDFSERDTGLINTRPAELAEREIFLSVIVDSIPAVDGVASPDAAGSRVWIAGYEPVRGGARRVSPLSEAEWTALREVAARLSDRLGGSAVREPPPDG